MENPSTSKVSPFTPVAVGEDQEEQDPSLVSLISSNGFSDSEEYVQLLLQKEKIDCPVLSSSNLQNPPSQSKILRFKSIDYILKTRELLGFQFQTAYLSVTYLDRFLSIRTLQGEKPWAMQLLSVGCLSLAAKMQESNSWGLLSFQIGEFRFDAKAIQRMELLILYTLEWKMGSITPFAYLPYFISILFTETPPLTTLKRIQDLLVAIVKDVSLIDHYPSAIAIAAVLLSSDQTLTRNTIELKINAIPCSTFLDLEDVSNCYFIVQQLERDPSKIPKLLSSPDLSPLDISRMVDFKDSPATSSISSKRKRLEFDDNDDQNQGLPDKRQRESDK